MRSKSILMIAFGCAALGGCGGDPASEAPVQVQPGLYKASLAGSAFGLFYEAAPTKLAREVCVSADEAEHFPQVYARKYLSMAESCGGPLSERTGNRIAGKVVCPLSETMQGELVTSFEGRVAADRVDVDALMRAERLAGDAEQIAEIAASPLGKDGVKLKLTMERVGDCA